MIFTSIEEFNDKTPAGHYGLIIGNFDGVHLGHRKLIENFSKYCEEKKLKKVLITFSPHPYLFFHKNESFLIDSEKQKLQKLEELGIDNIIQLNFNEDIQKLAANDFIHDFILQVKGLKLIYLGHDFRMGKGKNCAKRDLEEAIKKTADIEVLEEAACYVKKQLVSSSMIRKLIHDDIESVPDYLGRRFSVIGKVVSGKKIGKTIKFPTINLNVSTEQLLPDLGVYITWVLIDGKQFEGITNIGKNPTVDATEQISFETHILYFDQDIYGKEVEVRFIKKIRNEQKFESLEVLSSQISKDKTIAQEFFRKRNEIKLALIGKNIAHSKSQQMYEKLLKRSVQYDLLDCENETKIPTLPQLKESYQGVSITSPYKKFFLKKVSSLEPSGLQAINALAFSENNVVGTNTDMLAAREILKKYIDEEITKVYLLGDGTMAEILILILKELDLSYQQFSRKKNNLSSIAMELNNKKADTLVINTCTRDYCFTPPLHGTFKFWDLNYNLEHHQQLFFNSQIEYKDGLEMLKLQAKYALSFWNLA